MNHRTWVILFAAAQVLACSSSDTVDLGADEEPPSTSRGASLSDYAGSWDGYVEAFKFADGTDRIRVVLDGNGAGHFEAGNDAPPLPAPDPDEYPPGWTQDAAGAPQPTAGYMVPGYEYAVVGATVANARIQLQTGTIEMFREWCELQTPILDTANSTAEQQHYGCFENSGYSVAGNRCFLGQTNEEIPCGKLACTYLCTCTATHCTSMDAKDIELDAAFDSSGAELTGTLLVPVGGRLNVRMTRR